MAVSNVTLPNGERVNISHDDGYSEVDILDFAYREYVTNTDPGSAFGRGIRDGVDLLQTSYGSTLEGIGSLLDMESLQQIGADTIAQQRGEIDAEAYRQQRYGDGDDGIIDYAMNLAGSSAPQMGSTFAGAAAGAAIGSGFFGIGAAPGAIIGGFLANMPYFYGDNRERQKEAIERGFRTEMDEGAAALYAVPASILDAAFSAFGAKFLSSGLLKAGGGLLTRATRGAVEGAIIEAPTELGQQFLNRYQAGLPIDSEEAKMEYMEAAKGGALLGGLFGGGGRAVFGSKEGPDAMPAPETEETVQMPPSVTTPEGQAASPEVGEILEGAQPLTDEDIQRAINTADTLEEQFPGQDSIRQEQMDQYRSDIENKKRVMQELDAALQPDQQATGDKRFEDNVAVEESDYILPDVELDEIARLDVGQMSDEELQKLIESYNKYSSEGDKVRNLDHLQNYAEIFNRELDLSEAEVQASIDKDNKKYNAERKRIARAIKERDARARGEVSQLSEADFDALAEEAQRKRGRGGSPEAKTGGTLTAQEDAAFTAELQRELSGDIAPEGTVFVDPFVENAETEAQPQSIVESAPVTAPAQEVAFKIETDINPNYTKGGSQRRVMGYKVRAKDGRNYYIESNPDADAKNRFYVYSGSEGYAGGQEAFESFPTKKAAVDFLREKKPEAAPAQEAAPQPEGALTQEETDYLLGQAGVDVTGEPEITSDEVLTDEQIQRGVESEQGATVESDIDGDVFVGASPFKSPVQGNAPIITRASLAGKKLFAYFSDRTRVGTYTGINPDSGINVELQGGPMYPFMGNNLEKKAGWAFSSEGMFTRFLNRVKKTDGVGLVTLYSKENLRANLTFLKAYVAEINYAIKEGNITEQRFLEIANNLREAAVKSKKKTNKLLDKPFKSIKDFEKALAGATFDVRAAAFFGYNKNKKGDNKGSKIGADKLVEEGFPNISTMVDLFNDPSLDGLENGTIVSAVQFDQNQDGPSTATTLGVSEHTSYKVVIKGEGLGFFSDPVLVSDVIPSMGRPRRAVERSAETSMADVQFQQDVTAGTDTGPEIADIINEGKTFANAGQLDRFISAVFAPIARKLGVDIVANYSITRGLQYNVTQGIIEYNPVAVINNTRDYLTAGMREELIHAAMHKVLINQNKGKNKVKVWVDFMTKLGKDLTPEQREALAGVYNNLGNDMEFGAEYSRAVIQEGLYGDITEVYAEGKSFDRIKKLFRSIQGFVARTFGSEVSNPEVAGVIRASADLLKAVDPSVRPSNQVVVGAAINNSVDLNPNSEITSQDVVEAGKPPSKRKIDLNFADKYLFTVSSVLGKIHPRLKLLIRDYYGLIQSKVLSYQTAMAPFFKKMRGIKNKEDLRRLKQLLMYSPMVADAGTAEQDALLAKYGMLEDYRNLIRPALDKLRSDLASQGVEVGDLFDYFPRRIKNFKALQAVKAAWGNTVGASFRDFIEVRNKRVLVVRSKMMDLNEELVEASDNNDQAGVQRISRELKDLSGQCNHKRRK